MKIKYFLPLLAIPFTNAMAEMKTQALDYSDAAEPLENPGIGFYRTQVCHFTAEGNKAIDTWGNISHLRMDISEFSDKAILDIDKENGDTTFGVSRPLTQDVLDAFEATLDNVRQRGKTAIVRFCYDPHFDGSKNCDPEQSVILGHLRQLGEVYARNTDVITFVELGMYGSWGEMHSSNTGSNENIAEALQTLLECTPPEIKIGVRRPDIIAVWMGVNEGNNYDGFGLETDLFQEAAERKGDTLNRVGMYNDGYLGSDSDLGTIGMGASGHKMTREMMVRFLQKYSQHTPYGGELVANANDGEPINTPTYLSQEGFRTHTSYLNYEWHQPTILSWKDSIFNGGDPEYDGKDGYTYVENHLGFRYILRHSEISESISTGEDIHMKLLIENVGFGNLTKKCKTSFVLKNSNEMFEIFPETPINPQEWLSQKDSEVDATIPLPSDLADGHYEVFIRLSEYGDVATDKNFHCIKFGNTSNQFDSSIGANLIGEITVSHVQQTGIQQEHAKEGNAFVNNGILHLTGNGTAKIFTLKGELIVQTQIVGEKTIDISGRQGETILCELKSDGTSKTVKLLIP